MTLAHPIARSSFEGLDLNDIVVFTRVVQHGSFTISAKHFGKSPSYMSKHVSQLESSLALTLLHRSTHRVVLTDAGSVFFEHCVRILGELDAAKANANAVSRELVGTLRVHSTPGIGQAVVIPAIAEYNSRFPTIKVELTFSVYSASLMDRGVDVLIGSRDFSDDDFSQTGLFEKKLGAIRYVVCASPAYLSRHSRPLTPAELSTHNCLIHAKQRGDPRLWRVSGETDDQSITVDGTFQTNIESAIRLAAIHGVGIARLPLYSVAEELKSGALIALFEGGISSDRTIKAFYPRSRYVPKKVYEFLRIMEYRLASNFG